MENIDMSTDRERPKTLAELETWRAKWARTLIGAHRSELEDADERHKARCEKLDKYFDIRSHEISKERSLLDTGHIWESWTSEVSVLLVGYTAR
jgi:hypothetical protein